MKDEEKEKKEEKIFFIPPAVIASIGATIAAVIARVPIARINHPIIIAASIVSIAAVVVVMIAKFT